MRSDDHGIKTVDEIHSIAMARDAELKQAAAYVMGDQSVASIIDVEAQERRSARDAPADMMQGTKNPQLVAQPPKILAVSQSQAQPLQGKNRGRGLAGLSQPRTQRATRGPAAGEPTGGSSQPRMSRPRTPQSSPTAQTPKADPLLLRGGSAMPVQKEEMVKIDARAWQWGCGPYEVNKLTGATASVA